MNVFGWPADPGLEAWAAVLLGCLCVAALVTDLRRAVIPNVLTVPFACAGIALHGIMHGWSGALHAGIGALSGLAVLWVLYVFGGVGAGDVKLFAAIGSATGWKTMLWILLDAVLIAGVIGAGILAFHWLRRRKATAWLYAWGAAAVTRDYSTVTPSGRTSAPRRFPFMLAVAPAAAWVCGLAYFT